MRLYHSHYGFLVNATIEYWKTQDGRMYGTFLDYAGTIVNLELREVEIF